MKPFEVCPRCQGEWKEQDDSNSHYNRYCAPCYLLYNPENGDLELNLYDERDGELCWYADEHECRYWYVGETTPSSHADSVMLPWLPYTITQDELEMYLVFS